MSHTSGRAYFHLHEPRCLPIRLTRTPKLGVVPERPVVISLSQSSHPNRHVYDERSNGPLVQKKTRTTINQGITGLA